MSDHINAATKYIATHRPESLEWGPVERVGPDVVEDVRRIKSHDGPNLILCGSSTLTSTLFEHGLADEVYLIVYPVLLGQGKRFFSEGRSNSLRFMMMERWPALGNCAEATVPERAGGR
jgi:dihydrofolate reductase